MDLSAVDLIKNHLFGLAHSDGANALKQLKHRWSQLTQTLQSLRQEDFLKVYWTSRHGLVQLAAAIWSGKVTKRKGIVDALVELNTPDAEFTAKFGAQENLTRQKAVYRVAPLTDVSADQLQRAIEDQHGGRAALVGVLPVKELFQGKVVWEGIVHVFDLEGHPKATRAYAWSSPIEGSDKRRFYAVLHLGGIRSPLDAVRAAIVAERKK